MVRIITPFDILARLYFYCINFIFWFVNLFQKKIVVPPIKDPLLIYSITKIRELIKNRVLTPLEVVEAYIARIEEVNPILNAVVYKNYDEAQKQAEAATVKIEAISDEALDRLYDEKPLFGLPFTVKDSMQVKGKPCTVGQLSRKLKNTPEEETAVAIQRMFDAGAVLLAITTVPEICMWLEVNTVAWGKTNNPYDSRRTCGGSSGGEGALQGAGASLMGIGSDIGGSIRIPAFHNGVFGFVASPGLIPSDGHLPSAPPGSYKVVMGRIGPLTRFSEDILLLLKILTAGKVAEPKNPAKNVKLKKLRYFCCEELDNYKIEPFSQTCKDAVMRVSHHFRSHHGAEVYEIDLPQTRHLLSMYAVSLFQEGEPNFSVLMKDVAVPSEPQNVWKELWLALRGKSEFSIQVMLLCLFPWFGNRSAANHALNRKRREDFKAFLDALLGKDGVLLLPSWPTQPQYHWEPVAKMSTFPYTGMINMLGLPAVQCPIGVINGLPIGVQVVANKNCDRLLVAIAKDIEQNFKGWVEPGRTKEYTCDWNKYS